MLLLLLLLLALLWAGSLAQDQEFRLQVQGSVTVQEGQCVSVPCTVIYPKKDWTDSTPAYGYWFREGPKTNNDAPVATNNPYREVRKETRGRFILVGDPQTNNCSLHITNAQKRDTKRYFFRVERGSFVKQNFIHDRLSVHVTDYTPAPDIHIQGTLESGHPNNITCTASWDCDGETPPVFSWIGVDLTPLGPRTPNSSVLTLIPGPQHHGTNLTCRVALPGGENRERTAQLNVTYALQNLTIMSWKEGTGREVLANGSSLQVQEGQSVHLVCKADSNPPSSMRWTRGSLTLKSMDPGVLKLPQVELEDHGKYICRAQQLESVSLEAFVTLSVKNPPQLQGPSCSWEDRVLHCSCSSKAQPPPSLCWWLGESLLEGNHSNASHTVTFHSAGPWANSSLSVRGELTSNLRLRCEAQNTHGKETVTVQLLPGRPGHRTGVIQGAVGGAGATALLAICLGLIILRICRKKWAEKAEGQEGVSQGHLNAPSSHHLPPAPAASCSEHELHYAALSFHNMKPHNPQAQETPYSEVKLRK
ncbi:sialic acid-binding Ig-like lectin 13 isoform X2 [Sturnira hondurensis]|uniref:sialic acid-binding Ig-like lectin 13 isoform X2 n=1 Tax=Sturnira hondurensis TaxID=192404 RepID=UPI00187A2DC9|nr:sialic acid-binding Ig-like lectin 13 isoform X2 [Sturnira hondurensis]